VGLEQVAIDPERDRWRAVAQAAADGEHIEARGDQSAGMGVTQRMQRRLDPRRLRGCGPLVGRGARGAGRAIPVTEHEGVGWRFAKPEKQPLLLLRLPMFAQHGDSGRRERDGASAVPGLGCLEDEPSARCLFERLLDTERTGIEVNVLPAQRGQLAATYAGAEQYGNNGIERLVP